METEEIRHRGQPEKSWRDCVKKDIKSFGLFHNAAEDEHD